MINFSDSNVWSVVLIIGVLLTCIMVAHILKRKIPFLNKSLLPASVLGGIIILVFTTVYKTITKESFFEMDMFSITRAVAYGENEYKINSFSGIHILEVITYHALAIGFICMGLRSSKKNHDRKRTVEIFNTGVTTVATYLIQAIVGLAVTMIAAVLLKKLTGFNPAAGILLCLGFGQGTGQALNFGSQYEADFGFVGGANFGLAIAALGFLFASIGGVIMLNILRRRGRIKPLEEKDEQLNLSHYQTNNEIPVNQSIDKLTIQIALIIIVYAAVYLLMFLLSKLIPGMTATIFGFNFLFGTLFATLFKFILNKCNKKKIVNRVYINDFMMNRIAGVAFDIMIVAGIAAIDIANLKEYLGMLLIMATLGAAATFIFIRIVTKTLFHEYRHEQFFAMYGMLTGTASTGVILLREIDPNFDTPASDNLVYQNLPAILFGIPILILVPTAAKGWTWTLIIFGIAILYLIILLLILFRSRIFKKKNKKME